jgi:nucleolysin TIA-1/TIAR
MTPQGKHVLPILPIHRANLFLGPPAPAGRGWDQGQGGFAGPQMAPQGYQQMPGGAGGYGRGQAQPPAQQWAQPNNPGFGNGFGGYQG